MACAACHCCDNAAAVRAQVPEEHQPWIAVIEPCGDMEISITDFMRVTSSVRNLGGKCALMLGMRTPASGGLPGCGLCARHMYWLCVVRSEGGVWSTKDAPAHGRLPVRMCTALDALVASFTEAVDTANFLPEHARRLVARVAEP